MMTAPNSNSNRNSPFKMPTLFEQPSQRLLGGMVPPGRRSRDRSLSPKRDNRKSKSPCRVAVAQFQTMLGKVIDVDDRVDRPFCSSSITLPDFGGESWSRFPTCALEEEDSDDDGDDHDHEDDNGAVQPNIGMHPLPPTMMRSVSTDSRPSMPKRRESDTLSIGTSTSGSALDCSGRTDWSCPAGKSPGPPERGASLDKIPCVPGRQCSATSSTSAVSAAQRESLATEQ